AEADALHEARVVPYQALDERTGANRDVRMPGGGACQIGGQAFACRMQPRRGVTACGRRAQELDDGPEPVVQPGDERRALVRERAGQRRVDAIPGVTNDVVDEPLRTVVDARRLLEAA